MIARWFLELFGCTWMLLRQEVLSQLIRDIGGEIKKKKIAPQVPP